MKGLLWRCYGRTPNRRTGRGQRQPPIRGPARAWLLCAANLFANAAEACSMTPVASATAVMSAAEYMLESSPPDPALVHSDRAHIAHVMHTCRAMHKVRSYRLQRVSAPT